MEVAHRFYNLEQQAFPPRAMHHYFDLFFIEGNTDTDRVIFGFCFKEIRSFALLCQGLVATVVGCSLHYIRMLNSVLGVKIVPVFAGFQLLHSFLEIFQVLNCVAEDGCLVNLMKKDGVTILTVQGYQASSIISYGNSNNSLLNFYHL